MEDGSTVEAGLVSNEGMVGIPVILGDNITTTTALVQIPDSAMQMDADLLRSEFNRGTALQRCCYATCKGCTLKLHRDLPATVFIN
jgi:hypothetical protein